MAKAALVPDVCLRGTRLLACYTAANAARQQLPSRPPAASVDVHGVSSLPQPVKRLLPPWWRVHVLRGHIHLKRAEGSATRPPARAAVAVFGPVSGAGRPAFGPAASSGGPAPLPVPPPCAPRAIFAIDRSLEAPRARRRAPWLPPAPSAPLP